MSEKEVRAVFDRYIEALNTHDFDRMTEFIHDEVLENGKQVTRDDIIAELKAHGDSVPDYTWRPVDVAVDGDKVASRLFNKGTHTKEWLGVPPTGRSLEFGEYSFHKVRDGRFYEMNYLLDAQAVQQQLDS